MPSQGSTPGVSTPATLKNKSPAPAANQYKPSSMCSMNAHSTQPHDVSTSLLTAGPERSPNSSPTRSASKKYFVSWKRQVPALSRGQDGSRDRYDTKTMETKTRPPSHYNRTLPIARFYTGSLLKCTCLNIIRSIRVRFCA